LADPAAEAEPPVAEVSPPDPAPTPAPEATALAMAKLAELAAEQSAVAPPQPATSAPIPTKSNQTAALAAPPAEPPPATQLQDATWLRTRDPRRYTIQLFSGKDLDKLEEVAAMIGSDEPRAYFMTGSRTSPWYSLVLGDYPDASTARAAAANLTASLALKPWVRRFDDLQSSLR
jgi:septal ring-binding cell division protein DamX